MTWDITAECVSVIVIFILLVNSSRGNLLPTLRNTVYRGCLYVTLVCVCLNIVSTILLGYIDVVPISLNYIILILYFLITPLMGIVYYLYSLSNVFEDDKNQIIKRFAISSVPGLLYAVSVLSNPYTNFYFTLDIMNGYQQGPLIIMTYVIFYVYVIFSVLIVVGYRQRLDRKVMWILAWFPIVSGLLIVVQILFPHIMLTGCAAMCALLIVYLYLQNKQMFIDALTRLFNQREFSRLIELKLQGNHEFVVMIISLKDFKFINDKFGLTTGDKLLVMLCDFLKTKFPARNLYRYSGDEFAIISDQTCDVSQYIADIRKRMEEPWAIDGNEYLLNYSLASICCPSVASTREDMVKGLDYAIDKAKKEKGNMYYQCSEEMLQTIQRNYQIVEVLKKAVRENSFNVYFQPIYDVKKHVFSKAEALVRLPENPLGFVSPDEFIPIAEETGLIIPLTYCVLDKACMFINEISKSGIYFNGVSVNFSIVQFMQEDLEDKISEILKKHNVPYEKLKIEITESVLSSNTTIIERFITRMKMKGVQFLLDDFGTGYSNFTYVMNLPFHSIKLDKSFVSQISENERAKVMVTSVIQTFKRLGFLVLAEGIETQENLNYLIANDCDYIQGFYYSKPLPYDQALHYIVQHNKEHAENNTV